MMSFSRNSRYQSSGELLRLKILRAFATHQCRWSYMSLKTKATSHLEPFQPLLYTSIPLANVNVSLTCSEHNCEYNRFQWVLWVFLVNHQIWEWFWETSTWLGIRNEGVLCGLFPLTLYLDPNSLHLGSKVLDKLGSLEDCTLTPAVWPTLGRQA